VKKLDDYEEILRELEAELPPEQEPEPYVASWGWRWFEIMREYLESGEKVKAILDGRTPCEICSLRTKPVGVFQGCDRCGCLFAYMYGLFKEMRMEAEEYLKENEGDYDAVDLRGA